jgi:hypothetical protein
MSKQLYTSIWKKVLPDMLDLADTFPHHSQIGLCKEDFETVGNRESYSFHLEFIEGKIANNIAGLLSLGIWLMLSLRTRTQWHFFIGKR